MDHITHTTDWEVAMRCGDIYKRVFSEDTISIYKSYVKNYLEIHKEVSYEGLKKQLRAIPPHQFAKKDKIYKAVICFAKHLIEEGKLGPDFLKEAARIRPERHVPVKRIVVEENGLERLLEGCLTFKEKATVLLLVKTGLRASEVCDLRWEDVDFENNKLFVQKAKWGKSRYVGLSREAQEALAWIKGKPTAKVFGGSRYTLYRLLKKIGARVGVAVSPHALRRAFVTINANKGRSMVILQKACGHSSVKVTEGYCMTTQQEVIDQMAMW